MVSRPDYILNKRAAFKGCQGGVLPEPKKILRGSPKKMQVIS